MRNGQHHHSTSLFFTSKDTIKSRHCTPFEEKSAQPHAAASTSRTAMPATASPHTDTPGTALSIVDCIIGSGNKAKIVSQSKRSELYQVTLFDHIPHEFTSTWVPIFGDAGVEAEITVTKLGEECKIHAIFSCTPSSYNRENGRYFVEVSSLEEFKQFYFQNFPKP